MTTPPPLSRRTILAGTAAAAALTAAPVRALAATNPGLGGVMRERAQRWLDAVNEEMRERARFTFDSDRRNRWNYMLGSRRAPGVPLEDMSEAQKDLALDLLASGLSSDGLETAQNIMLQQDILRDEWNKGSRDRNRERFSLMIFGEPAATGPWSWRWEGHHLTITFTLLNDQVIAQTPKAFSSEPNTVPSGPYKDLVVLPENETLARALFDDLSTANRRTALLRESSIGNITTSAGRETRIAERQGVPLGDLPQSQQDKVRRLMAVYLENHLAGPLKTDQTARLESEDLAAVRFGWAGRNVQDESIYYRIHGETFLIEFATLFNQPQHHHTAVHDLDRNLGRHLI